MTSKKQKHRAAKKEAPKEKEEESDKRLVSVDNDGSTSLASVYIRRSSPRLCPTGRLHAARSWRVLLHFAQPLKLGKINRVNMPKPRLSLPETREQDVDGSQLVDAVVTVPGSDAYH